LPGPACIFLFRTIGFTVKIGITIAEAATAPTVKRQRRSLIAMDPRIRGYRGGYDAGDGLAIPSSYDAFNLFAAYGRDLGQYTRMETKFSLLDQGETEYVAQFFDVDQLSHYGITHSFIHRNEETGLGWRLEGWFSNRDFNGDTDLAGKRRDDFPVLQRVDAALADAAPGVVSSDARFNGDVQGDLTEDLDSDDTLTSFYLTNDIELSDAWMKRVGFGYAERVPDLTDRYSDGLFLATIQRGFSRVIGNPIPLESATPGFATSYLRGYARPTVSASPRGF
jgi:hypothetical protein